MARMKQCSQKFVSFTPQPLYNTIVRVPANFRFRYPNRVIGRVKCIDIEKSVLNVVNDHFGSNMDLCNVQTHVLSNHIMPRFQCSNFL